VSDFILLLYQFFFILDVRLFQLPVFIFGMRGLWKSVKHRYYSSFQVLRQSPADSRSIYVLLLIYAASTATTTLACLAVILTTPVVSPESVVKGAAVITPNQLVLLLSSYLPFFLVPLYMTLDMASRVLVLVKSGVECQKADKME
jgi:hypothetical protein